MCMTSGPAKLSNTHLYAGEAQINGTYVHVIAYQNHANSPGPNAMVLPIPAAAPVSSQNVVDTRAFKNFLKDIGEANRRRTRSFSKGIDFDSDTRSLSVFDVGSYTVVLADRPSDIASALKMVPEAKRPTMSQALLSSFETNYPGWPVAVCCWAGDIKAEPLLWWYQPRAKDWLFAPALDAHDGGAPDLYARVSVDHNIAFGSTMRPVGGSVRYQDSARNPAAMSGVAEHLLPSKVVGTALHTAMPNGDFWFPTESFTKPSQQVQDTGALRFPPGLGTPKTPVPLRGWE